LILEKYIQHGPHSCDGKFLPNFLVNMQKAVNRTLCERAPSSEKVDTGNPIHPPGNYCPPLDAYLIYAVLKVE
jgi:hypothetical protein